MLARVREGFWTSAQFFLSSWSESKNIFPVFLSLAELVWNEVSVQIISNGHGAGLQ